MTEAAEEEAQLTALFIREGEVASAALLRLTTMSEDRLLDGLRSSIVEIGGAVSETPERRGPPALPRDRIAPIGGRLRGGLRELSAEVMAAKIGEGKNGDPPMEQAIFICGKIEPPRLWRWCADTGTPLVYASSAATYGDGAAGFDDAGDRQSLLRLKPLNGYGWSKLTFDR